MKVGRLTILQSGNSNHERYIRCIGLRKLQRYLSVVLIKQNEFQEFLCESKAMVKEVLDALCNLQ